MMGTPSRDLTLECFPCFLAAIMLLRMMFRGPFFAISSSECWSNWEAVMGSRCSGRRLLGAPGVIFVGQSGRRWRPSGSMGAATPVGDERSYLSPLAEAPFLPRSLNILTMVAGWFQDCAVR